MREHRQDERLAVPERVTVVSRAGEALGGDRAPLCSGGRLQDVEESEANGLLQLGVAFDRDVRARPEVVEVATLVGEQPFPPREARRFQRRGDLVAQRGDRALARPPVGDELDEPEAFSWLEHVGHGDAGRVGRQLRCDVDVRGTDDDVVHGRGDAQTAALRPVNEVGRRPPRMTRPRARAASRERPAVRGSRAPVGSCSLATSSDCTTTLTGPSTGSTS